MVNMKMNATSTSSSSRNGNNSSREQLLRSTEILCDVFANHGTIEEIISCFSTVQSDQIHLFEHGLSELELPFVGRSFYGIQGIKDYFTIISQTLDYENMSFCDYSIDEKLKVISVRGKAKFIWKSTGKSWNEIFIYRIQLDKEGKILIYEVWADSGAAYLASAT
mmetsp:Transcript_33194/g.37006  ORF Transcript_33194/g.37006 Transcript_33194/m.37006 type:complete len:165 (-) Transcript_33194:121-615(-)